MWWLPDLCEFSALPRVSDVCFLHCCWDIKRANKSRWRYFPYGMFDCLSPPCRCEHVVPAWGRDGKSFATAAEVSYPSALCTAAADALRRHLDLPLAPALDLVVHRPAVVTSKVASAHRVASGVQPRGAKCPPVLPEYRATRQIVAYLLPGDPRTKPGHKWSGQQASSLNLAPGCVTLRAFWKGGGAGRFSRVPSESNPADAPSRGVAPSGLGGWPAPVRDQVVWDGFV